MADYPNPATARFGMVTSDVMMRRGSACPAWTSLLSFNHDAGMSTDLSVLAKRLVDCAATAQAREDNLSPAPSVLKHYREDARAVTAPVLKALIPVRKKASAVTLELPDLGCVPLADLIVAVERVEVP